MMKIKPYTIDLSEQMAVCDANYIRLLKLLGSTRSLSRRIVGLPHLGPDSDQEKVFVCLEVQEDFKYTSTIRIRQLLSRDNLQPVDQAMPHDLIGQSPAEQTIEPRNNPSEREASGTTDFTVSDGHHDSKGRCVQYHTPEMMVRVYHDAKTAEVTSYQNHRYFKAIYSVPNQFMYQSDEKEQLNLFLAEWLNLCIDEGLSDPAELQLNCLSCP